MSQNTKEKSTPSSPTVANESNKTQEAKTWGERNGGTVLGAITFGLLALATFVMWLANNA
jgi:hypothetical protein